MSGVIRARWWTPRQRTSSSRSMPSGYGHQRRLVLHNWRAHAPVDVPLGAPERLEHLIGHRQEERLLVDLAGMGAHGVTLPGEPRPHVDRRGDQIGRYPQLELIDRRRFVGPKTTFGELAHASQHLVAVHRRFV